jgi:drug/metabolite transporter (DMT)-like permease
MTFHTSTPNRMHMGASLFTAFLCIIFGANAVAIKFSLTGLGSFTNAGIRFSIAALGIYLWARYKKKPLMVTKKKLLLLFILSIFYVSQASCYYFALTKTSVSHGTLIANLLPFFVLILAHFFNPGDRFTLKKAIGISIGFIGVTILFMDNHTVSSDLKTGDLIMLSAVFFWSCNAVFAKKIIHHFSSLQITWYPMVFGIPIFFICGYFFDPQMIKTINFVVIKALLFQALVATIFGFVAWNTLLRRYGATSLHSFVFIMPLSGVFFGVLLLDEKLTSHLIISIILIVIGIIVVNRE